MKDLPRVKAELAIVRERTVAEQGYDSFLESIVQSRASEIMNEVVTKEMQQRSQRLIDVAADMLVSQGVAKRSDDRGFAHFALDWRRVFARVGPMDMRRHWNCSMKDGKG